MEKLAIHGGPAALEGVTAEWPVADPEVREILEAAFQDGSWGRYEGPYLAQLTEKLKEIHGTSEAYLCSSGTIAVELALRGLGVKSDDEVILAGYDFAGNFRAIEAIGARPVLVDLADDSWATNVAQLHGAVNAQTRAIIASHLHGDLANMPALVDWAHGQGVLVVEDACQCPGAQLGGQIVGTWGDVGVFSFGGSKLLTAGRGGALITDDAAVIQRLRVHCERGNHFCPLSELQAAVLLPQWNKLAERNETRWRNVQHFLERVRGIDRLQAPAWTEELRSLPAFFKLGLRVNVDQLEAINREGVVAALQGEGVVIDAGFRGFLHRKRRCRVVGDLPNSQRVAEQTLVLHHPILLQSPEAIERLAEAFLKVFNYLADESDAHTADQ